MENTRDFLARRRLECCQNAPAACVDRPYNEGEFERYERLSHWLAHEPYDVEPRECWPVYDRSQSQYHNY